MKTNYDTWRLSKWKAPAPPSGLATEPDHRVGMLARQENIEIMLLASFGMKLQVIADFVRLPKTTVTYRLKRMGIKVSTYREGRGPIAGMVLSKCTGLAAKRAIQTIREHSEE